MKIDPSRPPSILIVDDTPANLQLLAGMLKERGYRVRPAPSGEVALKAARVDPPELVLLDIRMPGMDGFEVCRQLKAEPTLRDIPVLFISAATDLQDKVAAFAAGGLDYISKPFQVEEVQARVETHLELRRQQRALQESYDKLASLEQLRDTLVHMIVHDLRSPLAVMSAALQLLEAGAGETLPAELRRYIQTSLGAAERMGVMVTATLDVSKIESGAMRLALGPCDVNAVVAELLEEMRGLVGERTVSFTAAAGAGTVRADRGLVARVVQNLLSNALRFTPQGGAIRISTETSEKELRLAVVDNGPGVPREMQDKIFEKFGQVEAISVGRPLPSTGLGLTFCKMAVEAHGGRIGLQSGDGRRGSTFWFTLPRSGPPARDDTGL